MSSFRKRLQMAWRVLFANECIVIINEDDGFHYMHNGVSLAFAYVFMKIFGNAKLWHKEWMDLNSVDK